ncbi:hypothetical protein NW768_000965 [Fusarium equiseti]|uniref:Uncharacterized protein n=1 Tax=Fusarium equiseti TaxID=61235 RepID=A0ABQ8RU03_FUSEQ|nr:hypothetical protein NW768_000965 [Fusarium equiseti]
MATVDDYFASRQCVWDDFGASGNLSIKVSEIRQSRGPDSTHQTLTHAIHNESLPGWLSRTADDIKQMPDTCLARMVWFPYDRRQGKVDTGHGVLPAVTQSFNHQLAQSRLRATFAGVSSVTDTRNGNKTYWFCNHPHLAVTWSRDPNSQIMNVIFIAQPSKVAMLQDLVACRFVHDLAVSDTLPTLLCSILLCREIDHLLIDVKNQVRQAEVRTGHHRFANRFEMPASGDLLQLSATMSGCESNLAVLTRRLGVLATVKEWTDDLAAEDKANLASATAVSSTVQQHSSMQQLDIDFFKKRTQTQREAVGNWEYFFFVRGRFD